MAQQETDGHVRRERWGHYEQKPERRDTEVVQKIKNRENGKNNPPSPSEQGNAMPCHAAIRSRLGKGAREGLPTRINARRVSKSREAVVFLLL